MSNLHPTMAAFLGAGLSLAAVRDGAIRDAQYAGLLGDEADDYADRVTVAAAERAVDMLERDRDRALDRGDGR